MKATPMASHLHKHTAPSAFLALVGFQGPQPEVCCCVLLGGYRALDSQPLVNMGGWGASVDKKTDS